MIINIINALMTPAYCTPCLAHHIVAFDMLTLYVTPEPYYSFRYTQDTQRRYLWHIAVQSDNYYSQNTVA